VETRVTERVDKVSKTAVPGERLKTAQQSTASSLGFGMDDEKKARPLERLNEDDKLVRRKIDWNNVAFLLRLVRRGCARGEDDWRAAWKSHCEEHDATPDFSRPLSKDVIVSFVEQNMLPLVKKEWAKDLMFRSEGGAEAPPEPQPGSPSFVAEQPEEPKAAQTLPVKPPDETAGRGNSRGSSSSSSSSNKRDAKPAEKPGKAASDSDAEANPGALPGRDSKTRMCTEFLAGRCLKKSKHCIWAHAETELKKTGEALQEAKERLAKIRKKGEKRVREDPPLYKTQMCPYWRGGCSSGNNCFYAHTHEELRKAPPDALAAMPTAVNPMAMMMGSTPMMMGAAGPVIMGPAGPMIMGPGGPVPLSDAKRQKKEEKAAKKSKKEGKVRKEDKKEKKAKKNRASPVMMAEPVKPVMDRPAKDKKEKSKKGKNQQDRRIDAEDL
jgi:hypothetical protein